MRWTCLIIAILPGVLGGCMRPIDATGHPTLSQIQAAFNQVVAEIHARADETWHADWYGNFIVGVRGGDTRGLCWHWQEAVYTGMKPRVHQLGWAIDGIAMNADEPTEHHAVIVYNPRVIRRSEIFDYPTPRPVWVLDAWQHGKPEIYLFDDWLKFGSILPHYAELEDMEYLEGRRSMTATVSPTTRPESH